MTGDEFSTSRGVLEAKRKQLKSRGKGNKPLASDPITAEHVDMFWDKRHDGKTIQNTVFFYLNQGFGFRGNHESRQLCWGDVKLKSDEKGDEFLVFNERLTKTRTGGSHAGRRAFQPKIFETGDDRCPIQMYKYFMHARPEEMCKPDSPFYFTVKKTNHPFEYILFACSPLGKNKIQDIVLSMAKATGITSVKLTNHSLRKKMVTDLFNANVAPNLVCQVSGHKNANSLNNYVRASILVQKNMSKIITDDFGRLDCERRGVMYGQKRPMPGNSVITQSQILAKRVCHDSSLSIEMSGSQTTTVQKASNTMGNLMKEATKGILQNATFNGTVNIQICQSMSDKLV